jgi:hypothetical protein
VLPRETYEAGRASAEARVKEHEARISVLGALRVVVAMGAIGLVIGIVWGHLESWAWGALFGLGAIFVGLVIVHARAFDAKARATGALRFHQRGLSRLDGTWRAFPTTGASYGSADHPYADDLDVFGPSSLFQLLDATETPFGRDALAALLSTGAMGPTAEAEASWAEDLVARQQAVKELAPDLAWRERLSLEGGLLRTEAPNPAPFLAWAEGATPLEVPVVVVWLARLLPLVVLAAYLLAPRLGLPKLTWVAVVVVELAISRMYGEGVAATMKAVVEHAGGFARYGLLFGVAVDGKRSSPRLVRVLSRLAQGEGAGTSSGVVGEMKALERVVSFVDARQNEVFKLFIGPVLMWDLNFAVLLERWRRRSGARLRSWFQALGELEAFASLAGFTFDRPDHAWPVPMPEAQLRAKGLGHPLIDAGRRIGNDVDLARPGTALVVTGSNMSGKSTLLRAMGVNTVLAQAGAPVCATSFALGHVTLATSMRVRDSLDEGVSHFYAELQKLKRVVDLAGTPPPLLFLLDEILHGTNSRERIIGARSVIQGLVARGALGAVSTHDLGIADLAAALPDAVKNVHFEEQVNEDGTMTFDYRLREGTVQSSNALRLMRAIGLDVPLEVQASDALPAPLSRDTL